MIGSLKSIIRISSLVTMFYVVWNKLLTIGTRSEDWLSFSVGRISRSVSHSSISVLLHIPPIIRWLRTVQQVEELILASMTAFSFQYRGIS